MFRARRVSLQATEDVVLDYMAHLGLDPTFPLAFLPIAAGSSKVELGLVPAQELTLAYPDIETMNAIGSQSRVDGGMHFRSSVPESQKLCKGIGSKAVEAAIALYTTTTTDADIIYVCGRITCVTIL